MKKMKARTLRTIVTFAVLVLVAIGYFTAWGIGNLSGFGWDAFSVLCPLGYLESLVAGKTFVPRAFISFVVILVLIVVFGRVFCAWICPMPTLQRLIPGVRGRKRKADAQVAQGVSACEATADKPAGKVRRVRFDSRFGVLLGALASAAIFGFPVFCLICPVGLTFATVLLVMRLFAFGDATWTVVAFPAIIALEILLLPKWCQRFCPLGALLSLFSGLNRTFRPQVDAEKCLREGRGKACNLCEQACPEGINLHDVAAGETTLNDCSKCRACADVCPERAITFPLLPKKQAQATPLPVDDEIPERG